MSVSFTNSQECSSRTRSRSDAFTRVELLVLITLLGGLAMITLPLWAGPRPQQDFAVCRNNLRQIGQAFLSFADAHGDKFPPSLRRSEGGSQLDGTVAALFRPLSNYLSSPRLLNCPGSTRKNSSSFETLSDANVSYLYGAHAAPDRSQEILSGDSDLTGGSQAICSFLGNQTVTSFDGSIGHPETFSISWVSLNHVASGNLLLSDGSVTGGNTVHLKRVAADSAREGSRSVHILNPK